MSSGLNSHFRLPGRYNRLANERLYTACAQRSDTVRREDRGAFFRSVHGTLNYILVGDRIWMARFEGSPPPPTRLDAILYDDFDALRAACIAEDARIETYADTLDDATLVGTLA